MFERHRNIRAAIWLALGLAVALPGAASAGTDFGTDEQVREKVDELIAYIKANGTDAAVAALADESTSLGGAEPGLMVWIDGVMGAHNKYPDLGGVDFEQMQDLRGQYIVNDFTENANNGGGYSLNYWPHYETEQEYEYHCFSKWVEKGSVMVTGCR